MSVHRDEKKMDKLNITLLKYSNGQEITLDTVVGSALPSDVPPEVAARRMLRAVESGIPEPCERMFTDFMNGYELGKTLELAGINTALYGRHDTKSLQELCDEVNMGLSHLEGNRIE